MFAEVVLGLLLVTYSLVSAEKGNESIPVVLWHGMGMAATFCFTLSEGR